MLSPFVHPLEVTLLDPGRIQQHDLAEIQRGCRTKYLPVKTFVHQPGNQPRMINMRMGKEQVMYL
ncbi:hypothetical protein FQZ97_1031880 [compost metagenome]